ncbi:zf-HC2 domain-containing protein [Streptomyces bambusae]|uniref:anti-sigma factor family protein n=1 Tax=Streptomyces bambusae TaxID=1550616 RepID=UPI001CFEC0D7|nr:zf-HC2 domain-containing protein [Streptomyces bambusae]MCB5166945.1 zf-HC2 domain-containing protein [Streptomyces bambusae]
MSGVSPSPAEQHLGDRLAALVDGELGHDARERVLAHLATCARCKAEADAQRQLKSMFVQSAQPAPSEGLLARLQGLPGGDPFSVPEYLPAEGFRIHEVARPAARGRRFAFAAAGAVSLAAIALGGALPLDSAIDPNARGEGGASVTPATRSGTGAGSGVLSVTEAGFRTVPLPSAVTLAGIAVTHTPAPSGLPPVKTPTTR